MPILRPPKQTEAVLPLPPTHIPLQKYPRKSRIKRPNLLPRLIDIDPVLLSTLELEVMLNVPVNTFPRSYLMELAGCAAKHFVTSGRYPGWGACFDVLRDHHGRIIGASYRYERCVCKQCPGWNARHEGWVGCSLGKHMRRY
jgi:hypothetical protein